MKYGRKYLEMLKNKGKIDKVIKMATENSITCSICGHGVRSHYVPNAENMSTTQLTRLLMSTVKAGTRRYCDGTSCRECEK